MGFRIGEAVEIRTTIIPNRANFPTVIPFGLTGEVEGVYTSDKTFIHFFWNGQAWHFWFHDRDLALVKAPMVEPEFDLEDMELAEIIMDEMK